MDSEHILSLHNDDEHSFDYVVEALIEICQHNSVQAEQCACITHYKGKCEIKEGNLYNLSILRDQLEEKGLVVSLEINKMIY